MTNGSSYFHPYKGSTINAVKLDNGDGYIRLTFSSGRIVELPPQRWLQEDLFASTGSRLPADIMHIEGLVGKEIIR
jgi:hypothetical protein